MMGRGRERESQAKKRGFFFIRCPKLKKDDD